MEERQKKMGLEPVGKLLLKFSIPAIVGMMVQALYNIADRYFIGQMGDQEGSLAIAGITVSFPFALVAMGFGMLIGLGGMSVFSILLGEQKRDQAEKVLGNSFSLLVVFLLAFSVISLVFLKPLLSVFGASPDVLPYAFDYMQIIIVGSVFNGIGFGMNNFIRANGSPRTAMTTMLIGAILNIILAPILVLGLGMGVRGAAIATVFSQFVSTVWVLSYFSGPKSPVRIIPKNLVLDGKITRRILLIGLAPFSMQVAAGGINVLLNRQLLAYGGDIAISALGIIYSIALFFMMPIFGINQGAAPLIGYNYGAKKYDRVQKVARLAILGASSIVLTGFILVQLFARQFLSFFNQNSELLDVGERASHFFFLVFPFLGLQIVGAGYFQAVGKPKEAMLLSLSRQVLFLIPAVIILPLFFGLDGIWYAIPVADGLAVLVTGTLFFREMHFLKKGMSI